MPLFFSRLPNQLLNANKCLPHTQPFYVETLKETGCVNILKSPKSVD